VGKELISIGFEQNLGMKEMMLRVALVKKWVAFALLPTPAVIFLRTYEASSIQNIFWIKQHKSQCIYYNAFTFLLPDVVRGSFGNHFSVGLQSFLLLGQCYHAQVCHYYHAQVRVAQGITNSNSAIKTK
jgi:hypothetical protein